MKSFLNTRARVATPGGGSANGAPCGFKSFAAPASDSSSKEEPTRDLPIECVREGDRIVRLKIRCACGDEIEIDCLYETGSS
jgi:hypothetical protein